MHDASVCEYSHFYFQPILTVWTWLFPLLSYLVILVQLIGNGVIICVINTTRKFQKPKFLIIGSIAVSDFISACNSPIGAYREQPGRIEFKWPIMLCEMYMIIELMTTLVTLMSVGSLSLYRFLTICCKKTRPISQHRFVINTKSESVYFNLNRNRILCYLCFIWFIAILIASRKHFKSDSGMCVRDCPFQYTNFNTQLFCAIPEGTTKQVLTSNNIGWYFAVIGPHIILGSATIYIAVFVQHKIGRETRANRRQAKDATRELLSIYFK